MSKPLKYFEIFLVFHFANFVLYLFEMTIGLKYWDILLIAWDLASEYCLMILIPIDLFLFFTIPS